ncbi:MAG: hydantoinase B/oxoprolinase family protein [bacterium]
MNNVETQVHRHRLEGIASEMGSVLQQTAFSPNIKERRDFSCAIVDKGGNLVAQAAHIPVHLGAIPIIMNSFLDQVDPEPGKGYLMNDPYSGGTHLPDLSYVEPWIPGEKIEGFVINRAHHTDIGGEQAGSMAASSHIDQEGFRTDPRIISEDRELKRTQIEDLLEQSRTPKQRVTDLEAQISAACRGRERLTNWASKLAESSDQLFDRLFSYSRKFLKNLITEIDSFQSTAVDYLDGDGFGRERIPIRVRLDIDSNTIVADFTNSADQVEGNVNCPRSVTASATYYVIQTLLGSDVAVNQGVLSPVEIQTREGSILDAEYPAAVAGGNVETSQRIVDVLLKAFAGCFPKKVPAASQGTMNNVTLGWSDSEEKKTYYETLGGGAGGGPEHNGLSGRQVHMTNTLNTPIEEFERSFPILIEALKLRSNSGGQGLNRGGEGIVKRWRALRKISVGLLTERRTIPPYGLQNGEKGRTGKNVVLNNSGEQTEISSKENCELQPGEALEMHTPGGGGWGDERTEDS